MMLVIFVSFGLVFGRLIHRTPLLQVQGRWEGEGEWEAMAMLAGLLCTDGFAPSPALPPQNALVWRHLSPYYGGRPRSVRLHPWPYYVGRAGHNGESYRAM